jgi:hypothetical protein
VLPLAAGAAFAVGLVVGVPFEAAGGSPAPAAAAAQPLPAASAPADGDPAEVAYLDALQAAGVPVADHRDLVVTLGRQVCLQPAQRRADPDQVGLLIAAVLPGVYSPAQARAIVAEAGRHLC